MNRSEGASDVFEGVRRSACIALLVSMSISNAHAQSGQDLAAQAGQGLIGRPAPALVVQTIDGESIDLSKFYGTQAVYLKFWATWCVPCRQQMPHFQHVYEMAGPDLAVIGVNAGFNESIDEVRRVLQDDGLTMPTVIDDGRLAAALNLRVTPQHVVIGRDGRVMYVGHFINDELDAALLAVRQPGSAGAVVSIARTPAEIVRYGVGDMMPDLSTITLDGAEFRSQDASDGRPTVLVFLSPWCESYLATSRPAYATACREARDEVTSLAVRVEGVRWLGVASGLWSTVDRLREYEAEYRPSIPLAMDESGDWFRAFDVVRVPTIVISDASGRIVRRIEDRVSDLQVELDEILKD